MPSIKTRALRALGALPFLLIAFWCSRAMDLNKMVAQQQPFADSGVIEWDGGRVAIIDHFHGIDFLDQAWRGGMATFSVSSFGYDSIASWQVSSFLVDLGPVYAIWILESSRAASAWTPAYLYVVFLSFFPIKLILLVRREGRLSDHLATGMCAQISNMFSV